MIEPSDRELAELPDCSREYISALEQEIDRLQAIVDKLPKCWRLNENGELMQDCAVVLEDTIYDGNGHSYEVIAVGVCDGEKVIRVKDNFERSCRWLHEIFSYNSKEAAEAGRRQC